jgi:hypothetical protein
LQFVAVTVYPTKVRSDECDVACKNNVRQAHSFPEKFGPWSGLSGTSSLKLEAWSSNIIPEVPSRAQLAL